MARVVASDTDPSLRPKRPPLRMTTFCETALRITAFCNARVKNPRRMLLAGISLRCETSRYNASGCKRRTSG
jgi:hypothetical protein